ncbi:MAG: hypothetical protein IAF38_01335 [Bacteroidia bacterium]|nr:hypothetical protein [Bacteroidia bacterium]
MEDYRIVNIGKIGGKCIKITCTFKEFDVYNAEGVNIVSATQNFDTN